MLTARRRLRRVFESCWTLSPVVIISSAAEESEDDEGLDPISIHDSVDSETIVLAASGKVAVEGEVVRESADERGRET